MTLRFVHDVASARAALPDADAVVVVAVYNAYEDVVRCYTSFFAHSPPEVPLLVVDDGGADRRTVDVLSSVPAAVDDGRVVVVLQQPTNKGFVHGMNDAFAATGRSDVVLLNSDVVVGPEWFERLRAAAYESSAVATASTLTNHGTILSLPHRNVSTSRPPGELDVDEAARRVAAGSAQMRPRIPTAVAHCTYVRRAALDLVGGFDPAFSPGYSEEVDFCQRLIRAGMQHVCADDVFVYHRGGSTFGRSPEVRQLQEDHERLIKARYPYYHPWVEQASADETSTLAAAILTARVSLLGLRVGVDGLCLGPNTMGTQVVVLETVRALAARDAVTEILVYVPHSCPASTRALLTASPKVTVEVTGALIPAPAPRHDVMYRPYQVNEPEELTWLRSIGHRLVVNQLDLIAFHNPTYFPVDGRWPTYRQTARTVGHAADGLSFISQHAAQEARSEGLVGTGTPTAVVYCGTEHVTGDWVPAAVRPRRAADVPSGFLLFLGASYGHKNRPFALRLLQRLLEGGWEGHLVLAGPTPPEGSTTGDEAVLLLQHPELAQRVVDLGPVPEAEKAWLYDNAGLVLYPTVAEGFGLVPFEAAGHGVPCLSTRQGSLDEVLPADIPTMSGWDLEEAVALTRRLLTDQATADELVRSIAKRGGEFTWDGVAERLEVLFFEAVRSPARRFTPIGDGGRVRTHPRANRGFSWLVRQVSDRPDLKARISPPGSKREEYSRKAIRAVGSRL